MRSIEPSEIIGCIESGPEILKILSEAENIHRIGSEGFAVQRNIRINPNLALYRKTSELEFETLSGIRDRLEELLGCDLDIAPLSYRSEENVNLIIGPRVRATVRVDFHESGDDSRIDYFVSID